MEVNYKEKYDSLKSVLQFVGNTITNSINGDELVFQLNAESCMITKCRISSLFVIDTTTYEFKLTGKYSSVKTLEANRAFEMFIEREALPNVLMKKETAVLQISNYDTAFLFPLINKNMVYALQLVIVDKKYQLDEEQQSLLSVLGSIFTINYNNRNYKTERETKNTKDNTDLINQIESLKKGTEELHYIIDSIQEGIFLIDKANKQIYDVNLTAVKLISTSKESLIGKNKDDFFLFFDNNMFKDEIVTKEEALLIDADGNTIPILYSITDLTLGDYEYQIISFLDISERKMMEDKIQQSRFELEFMVEDRTRELLQTNKELEEQIAEREKAQRENLKLIAAIQQTASMVMITDLEGNIQYANQALCAKSGYALAELLGKKPNIFKSGDLSAKNYQFLWQSLHAGKSSSFEYRNKKKNGELYWVTSTMSPIKDDFGNIINFLSVQEEITERKKAEEENRKLLQAVEQTESLITITDLDYKIEYVNPALERKTNYKLVEVIGNTPVIFKGKGLDSEAYKASFYAVKNGTQWNGEHLMRKKEGELFWVTTHISPIRNREGIPVKYMAVQEDITERKKAETELKSAKEKVEKAEKAKSSLLANMSHEFRTPLISILGFSELLEYELTDKEQQEMIYAIQSGGKRLLNSLESILTLSHLESSNLVFNIKEINLIPIINNAVNLYRADAHKKYLELNFETALEEINVTTEEKYLGQTLNHLVDNAIKYTQKGEVKITLDYTIENNKDYILISVHDTGIGIAEEDQQLIFEAFRQASEGYNRNFEGFGLGLTIAQKTVHLMNGKLTVRSTPKAGSIFTIWLPFNTIK